MKSVIYLIAMLAISSLVLSGCKRETISPISITTSVKSVNTEIINGIYVPPEPDPVVNNATLAGVDVNKNGVRDDVERKIVKQSNKTTISGNLDLARAISNYENLDFTNRTKLLEYISKIHCLISKASIGDIELKSQLSNTQIRKDMFRKIEISIGGYGSDELKQCYSIDFI